jgi:chaperonin cofactor prefoldin
MDNTDYGPAMALSALEDGKKRLEQRVAALERQVIILATALENLYQRLEEAPSAEQEQA